MNWINVKDGLPEQYKLVLTIAVYGDKNSAYGIGCYTENGWHIDWSYDARGYVGIVYWTPIPDPPKGVIREL